MRKTIFLWALLVVMLFNYLNVKRKSESSRGILAKLDEKIYANRHISREEYGNFLCRLCHLGSFLIGMTRGAYNDGGLCFYCVVKKRGDRGMM